jgi:hypothetical protein
MLPTAPGISKDDNNYADNPYLLCLAKLGYKGAFWSRWRQREQIMREAVERELVQVRSHQEFVFAKTSP